mgnify:CR=1 FL=1
MFENGIAWKKLPTELGFGSDTDVMYVYRAVTAEPAEAQKRAEYLVSELLRLSDDLKLTLDLDILQHGLTLWDLDRRFPVGGFAGERLMALRDILGVLRNSYCRTVGVEYMHITDPEEREWLQQRIEVKHEQPDREKQKHVLGRLNAAEAFETFLQTKYVGQKRFSLEGGESLIPLLDEIISDAADGGRDERRADRERLDEVLPAQRHEGPADQRHVACGVVEGHFPHRVAEVHALAGGHAAGPWPRPMPQPRRPSLYLPTPGRRAVVVGAGSFGTAVAVVAHVERRRRDDERHRQEHHKENSSRHKSAGRFSSKTMTTPDPRPPPGSGSRPPNGKSGFAGCRR